MAPKRILVVVGHPSAVVASYGTVVAESYGDAARLAGHEVRLLYLDKIEFDPVLRSSRADAQPLEPDLLAAQQMIEWAGHITFVYPIWWGSIPALLKGFLDRAFTPGFAFKYQSGKAFPQPLLKGRSAHLVITMDSPPWYFRWLSGAPGLHQMKKSTLEFCGVTPVKTLMLGPIIGSAPRQREVWLLKARAFASLLR